MFYLPYICIAQKLNEREYVEQVYNYSLEIKSSRELSNSANYSYQKSRRELLPQFAAALTATTSFRSLDLIEGIDLKRYNTSADISVTQNIYSGSYTRNYVDFTLSAADISRLDELLTQENVVLAASVIYWQSVAALAYRDIALKYLEIIDSNYNLQSIKYESGATSKNDLLMMLTRKKQAQYDLSRAEKYLEKMLVDLNILRGHEPSQSVEFADEIEVIGAIIPSFSDPNIVLRGRNEYNISKLAIDQNIQKFKINRSQFLPKIALVVEGNYGTRLFNTDGSLIVDGAATIAISTPIFGWGQKRQQRLADMASVRAAEYNLSRVEDQISKEIFDNYTSLKESYEQLSLTSESLDIAQESLDLSMFSYDEGVISVVELLSSQLSWLSAFNSKISANLNYRISLLNYKKSTATLINGL